MRRFAYRLWGWVHRRLNGGVLMFGTLPIVGPAMWWTWGRWQCLLHHVEPTTANLPADQCVAAWGS